MGIEKYIAIASLGLFIMFVGEMVSLYHFMINPPSNLEFSIKLEPEPKILQFISIGVAPASILAGISFILSKQYGSKNIAILIISGGAVLLGGMLYLNTMVDKLGSEYLVFAVTASPPLFVGVSIAVIVVGALLFRINKPRPKKEYF